MIAFYRAFEIVMLVIVVAEFAHTAHVFAANFFALHQGPGLMGVLGQEISLVETNGFLRQFQGRWQAVFLHPQLVRRAAEPLKFPDVDGT